MPANAGYRAVTGTYGLRVLLVPREEASSDARTLEASFVVRDPIKERAKAACLARGDDWIVRGHFAGDEVCAEVMKDKIAEHAPPLGAVLEKSIKTGTYCSYRPSPS